VTYSELQVTTHFSFLRGASSPRELFEQAKLLGLPALGIVDRNSLAGIVRAYEAANKKPDVIVTLRTDEMGVICDWEKANDPNFKIYYSNGQNDQARFALTAAMMKKEGKDVPPAIDVPFKMRPVVKGQCDPAIPESASLNTLVDNDMMKAMFAKQ